MENCAEIRRLHWGERMPIKAITRRLVISKYTVRRVIVSDEPPRYERQQQGSAVNEFEFRIRELLAEFS